MQFCSSYSLHLFCLLFTLRARADYRLHRKEQLGYLHEVGENSLDMKDIDGPLDEDMHKMRSARTVFKAKGPVQITQKLHQQVRKKDLASRAWRAHFISNCITALDIANAIQVRVHDDPEAAHIRACIIPMADAAGSAALRFSQVE